MVPSYGWGSTASRLQSHYEEVVYFLLSSKIFLELIWLTSKGWEATLTLELPSGFEHGTRGLEIQHLNHKAIGKHVISC